MEMITVIPSEILRLNQGELAPGRQADWVILDLARPNLTPTRLDNVTENMVWAADGSEVDTVVARGRILKQEGRIAPFTDGATPEQIMKDVQLLSERFIVHLESTDELSGTGAHR